MPDGSLHADLNFRLADAGGDPIGLMGYLALRGDKWIRLTFQEPASPMRLVDILDDGSGAFRLAVADPRGKAELLFNQGRDGRFHLAWFSEGKWTAWSGKSFLSAYRAHAAFVDGTLFPALERLGFRVPWTRQDPKVIAAVCARLRPLSKQEQAEFDGLFRKMSSGDLAVRGEAVRDLSARYDLFRGAIANVLESPDTPLDVVSHLEEAIKREHPEPAAVSGWLFDSGLLEDPGYLMEILERVEGEPDRQAIGKRLARLTGKKSGTGLR